MPVQHAVFEPLLPPAAVTRDSAWCPQVDVREFPDEYVVLADLPGVEPGAVNVTSDANTLTIAGARRDRLRAGGVPFRLERPSGTLRRSLRLPGPCDRTKISTQIRDGVLEIRVPKLQSEVNFEYRDVEVHSSSGGDDAAPAEPRQELAQRGTDELAATSAQERDADQQLRHELGERRARAEHEIQEQREHV